MPYWLLWRGRGPRNVGLLRALQPRALLPCGLDKRDSEKVPARRLRRSLRPGHAVVLGRMRARLLVPRRLDKRDGRRVPTGHLRLERWPADRGLQRAVPAGLLLPGQLDERDGLPVPRGRLRRGQRPGLTAVRRSVHGRLVLPGGLELADGCRVPGGLFLRTRQHSADELPTGHLRRGAGPAADGAVQRPVPGRNLRRGRWPVDAAVLGAVRRRHLRRCGWPADVGLQRHVPRGHVVRTRHELNAAAEPAGQLLARGCGRSHTVPRGRHRQQHGGPADGGVRGPVPARPLLPRGHGGRAGPRVRSWHIRRQRWPWRRVGLHGMPRLVILRRRQRAARAVPCG